MNRREVITFPGPGGSSVSCCIIPCGCVVVPALGLLGGGVGLAVHARAHAARVAAAVKVKSILPATKVTAATAQSPSTHFVGTRRTPLAAREGGLRVHPLRGYPVAVVSTARKF